MIKKWIWKNLDLVVMVGSFPVAFVVGLVFSRILNGYWGPPQGWFIGY